MDRQNIVTFAPIDDVPVVQVEETLSFSVSNLKSTMNSAKSGDARLASIASFVKTISATLNSITKKHAKTMRDGNLTDEWTPSSINVVNVENVETTIGLVTSSLEKVMEELQARTETSSVSGGKKHSFSPQVGVSAGVSDARTSKSDIFMDFISGSTNLLLNSEVDVLSDGGDGSTVLPEPGKRKRSIKELVEFGLFTSFRTEAASRETDSNKLVADQTVGGNSSVTAWLSETFSQGRSRKNRTASSRKLKANSKVDSVTPLESDNEKSLSIRENTLTPVDDSTLVPVFDRANKSPPTTIVPPVNNVTLSDTKTDDDREGSILNNHGADSAPFSRTVSGDDAHENKMSTSVSSDSDNGEASARAGRYQRKSICGGRAAVSSANFLRDALMELDIPYLDVDCVDFDIFTEMSELGHSKPKGSESIVLDNIPCVEPEMMDEKSDTDEEMNNTSRKVLETDPANMFIYVCANVFFRYRFVEGLQLDRAKLINYFFKIQSFYSDRNPYHNSVHAADVLQTTHVYLCANGVRSNFTDVELLSLLFGCIIHDVGHLGINNHFLNKISHPLSVLYNDASPQESMHTSLAFFVLQDPKCDFFESSNVIDREIFLEFREHVTQLVACTDMKNHAAMITAVADILADGVIDDEEIPLLMKAIIHASDISNPMKPLNVYRNWVHRVVAEFWQQGDEERRRGLPISTMCDRHTTPIPDAQIGFINFIVKPFAREFEILLPKVWLERLEENLAYFTEIKGQAYSGMDEVNRLSAPCWSDQWANCPFSNALRAAYFPPLVDTAEITVVDSIEDSTEESIVKEETSRFQVSKVWGARSQVISSYLGKRNVGTCMSQATRITIDLSTNEEGASGAMARPIEGSSKSLSSRRDSSRKGSETSFNDIQVAGVSSSTDMSVTPKNSVAHSEVKDSAKEISTYSDLSSPSSFMSNVRTSIHAGGVCSLLCDLQRILAHEICRLLKLKVPTKLEVYEATQHFAAAIVRKLRSFISDAHQHIDSTMVWLVDELLQLPLSSSIVDSRSDRGKSHHRTEIVSDADKPACAQLLREVWCKESTSAAPKHTLRENNENDTNGKERIVATLDEFRDGVRSIAVTWMETAEYAVTSLGGSGSQQLSSASFLSRASYSPSLRSLEPIASITPQTPTLLRTAWGVSDRSSAKNGSSLYHNDNLAGLPGSWWTRTETVIPAVRSASSMDINNNRGDAGHTNIGEKRSISSLGGELPPPSNVLPSLAVVGASVETPPITNEEEVQQGYRHTAVEADRPLLPRLNFPHTRFQGTGPRRGSGAPEVVLLEEPIEGQQGHTPHGTGTAASRSAASSSRHDSARSHISMEDHTFAQRSARSSVHGDDLENTLNTEAASLGSTLNRAHLHHQPSPAPTDIPANVPIPAVYLPHTDLESTDEKGL